MYDTASLKICNDHWYFITRDNCCFATLMIYCCQVHLLHVRISLLNIYFMLEKVNAQGLMRSPLWNIHDVRKVFTCTSLLAQFTNANICIHLQNYIYMIFFPFQFLIIRMLTINKYIHLQTHCLQILKWLDQISTYICINGISFKKHTMKSQQKMLDNKSNWIM